MQHIAGEIWEKEKKKKENKEWSLTSASALTVF